MKETHLVTQSNSLIEARHKHALSAREQKLILTMVSMIQPDDQDFLKYEISIKDFHQLLGLHGREKYTEIKEIVETLMTKVIYIPQGTDDWIMTHWVSVAKYRDGKGIIELKFDPELKPYLLQLKKAFTSYRLSNILSLKSGYSIRMYELIKKWQHVGKWSCDIDELRKKLGVEPKKYPQYGNFKQRVLVPSISELNDKTDVNVTFTEYRKNRKVSKIEFKIQHIKEKEIQLEVPDNSPPTLQAVVESDETLRGRFNNKSNGYIFDVIAFEDIENKAEAMWKDEKEIHIFRILEHTNSVSIENRAGYYRSIINKMYTRHLGGETIGTEEYQPVVSSKNTGWVSNRKNNVVHEELTEERKEQRRTLLASLGFSPEEIAQKEIEYSKN